ncbi:MAG TPA: polysaccharide deacetylase family protein [Bacteroidia bacterium]|jgi:peptidoglycan/xylan/chitin deacetylase (PgdA/CDA1 family)|nr:polysaccharide deacetylase family protein [Bacteroidia bacterium]
MGFYHKVKRALACFFIRDTRTVDLSEAVISFCFDDVPNSALLEGRAILKKYGFAGTYYISLGLSELEKPGNGHFDAALLKSVVEEGGELGCHTYDHIHFYTSNKKQIADTLDRNQKSIDNLISGYTFKNFSYPYGEQTFFSKKLIRSRFSSGRSVISGINTNPVDLNNLKATQLDSTLKPEAVFALIDQAIARKAWLILYTHDVTENCSEWGCTPEYFEQVVKYCANKKVKTLTIEKTLINASRK